MKPKVYQISPLSRTFAYESGLMGKFENFLKDFDFSSFIPKDDVVPLKMHLGNQGAFRTIRPQFVKLGERHIRRWDNHIQMVNLSYEFPLLAGRRLPLSRGATIQFRGLDDAEPI